MKNKLTIHIKDNHPLFNSIFDDLINTKTITYHINKNNKIYKYLIKEIFNIEYKKNKK
tara:strand:- start:1800 stop:1973 length:174 start_codon:yes stop_codon:yes gene_type:complete